MKHIQQSPYFWPSVAIALIFVVVVSAVQQHINLSEVLNNFQWNVLIIAVAMSLFTTQLAATGAMNKIAVKFSKWSEGQPVKILVAYALLLFFFSAFLNNFTATLIILPSLFILLRGVKVSEFYIVSLFSLLLAVGNCAGASTPVGDFPAIIILSSGITSFAGYLSHAFPLFLVTALILIGTHVILLKRYVGKNETEKESLERILGVAFLDVQHRHFQINYMNLSVIVFIFISMFFAWSLLPTSQFPPEAIAVIGIIIASAITTARGARTGINCFDLKPFLMIASFLLIAGFVNNTGILVEISRLLEENIHNPNLLLLAVMLLTAVLTGLISAGPSAAAMMPVIQSLANGSLQAESHWLAIAFACAICAGSSLFFWSATAGFMLSDQVGKAKLQDIDAKTDISWGFSAYFKYGILHFLIQLSVGIAWVFTGLTFF